MLPTLKKLRPSMAVSTTATSTTTSRTPTTMPVEVSRDIRPESALMPPLPALGVDAGRQREHLLLGRTRGQLAGEPAVAHHQDPVGHADHLGQLARHHQDADAVGREGAHQLVDAVLGADVDAAGRLVHQHDPRPGGQPARQHDLLLVAAGEELDLLVHGPGRHGHRREQAGHLAPRLRRTPREDRAHHAERVVEDRLVESETGRLAVLGDHRESGPDRLPRGGRAAGAAVDDHLAAGERPDPEHRLEQLGAAGALQPGDADDLAGAQREVDPVDVAVAGAAQLEGRGPDLGAVEPVGEERRHGATDHQPHQGGVVEVAGGLGGDLAGRP